MPSPRPSDRVPFGTGKAVSSLVEKEDALLTYHPEPFRMLRNLFKRVDELFESDSGSESVTGVLPQLLMDFLEEQKFREALAGMRGNSASLPAFRKRFWRWFNMFRIMKFLHFARERDFPDIAVAEASSELLRQMDPSGTGIPSIESNTLKLLLIYRMIDARGTTLFPR
jgi:hypothetical protein